MVNYYQKIIKILMFLNEENFKYLIDGRFYNNSEIKNNLENMLELNLKKLINRKN